MLENLHIMADNSVKTNLDSIHVETLYLRKDTISMLKTFK